ncbi:hypothetical protein [Kitasatospora paranensis]|uniref:Uncharacterized protein n=1 Tax=Kitasatospora paranensis TaxID=258053 RepID=A0ABW2FQ74_9ACTN
MSSTADLPSAITQYVAANQAVQDLFRAHPDGDLHAAQIEPLLAVERQARTRYAAALQAAGRTVPVGLLDY